ncbi:FKBP-type peptidyl-prolyl cis-trans isomerase [Flavobacterium litorale]|uniref:peptidylprolyl isomerase n=1 Tax=Flavobacterium litorale TaxID=2856519 RepID=A0ABX8V3I3_9FLAO|nr:FKBP-type peptidylprolyl isomerase [Flavobacterium litorale]QYJ67396.1 FKBP-type peptidylprolyl isomerase [Flavobacterium litorale]
MKRFFKVFSLLAFVAFFAACNKDDGSSVEPPRDYAEQYAVEKVDIENYLKEHYIASVDEDFNVTIEEIPDGGDQVSIWDQTEYELLAKDVNLAGVNFELYYLVLRQGVNEQPTRADRVRVAYRGFRLDGTQFDSDPFPQDNISLITYVNGWHEIIPLFKTGVYIDEPDSPNPAEFEDYGAGIMFLPSAYGYYNNVRTGIPAYNPLVFSFKLYDLQFVDSDGDGILSKYETDNGIDIRDFDSDGDGAPDYLDIDDDNDGYSTRLEITIPDTDEVYDFEDIPTCDGGTVKKHLDASCF